MNVNQNGTPEDVYRELLGEEGVVIPQSALKLSTVFMSILGLFVLIAIIGSFLYKSQSDYTNSVFKVFVTIFVTFTIFLFGVIFVGSKIKPKPKSEITEH